MVVKEEESSTMVVNESEGSSTMVINDNSPASPSSHSTKPVIVDTAKSKRCIVFEYAD